ncbi:hypothetical protein [Kitasatospora purpeofusca]|uniref:hypothetical protein n=1 Tax=Kitasatospora purpeofusca TaxID=67352 RepID=UPI00386ABF57|nr:hypothetical protein OIP63_03825 [Kitasatospora purpeofusca]
MTEGTRGGRGMRTPAEGGRMTAEDTDRFRVLLARLEDSLAADRRGTVAVTTVGAPRPAVGRDG